MKSVTSKTLAAKFIFLAGTIFLFLFLFIAFCSFQTNRMADDFLKQLGITKANADDKITNSILGGSVDAYGVKNAKNILLGNRKAVVLDLLAYTKKHVNSPAFLKEYNEMKQRNKPTENIAQTPEAMKAENIANAKKFVADMEATVKKADPGMKAIFEKSLEEARKNLIKVQDPIINMMLLMLKIMKGL